jgi:hypothetical protein
MTEILRAREPTPLMRVRSTILVSGLAELRTRGLYDAYLTLLDPAVHDAVREMVAGVWVPTAIAMKHFEAVDGLAMTAEESFAVGAGAGRRFQATLWGTLVRVAVAAGADPWIVLEAYDRLWGRGFDGGGFVVSQEGPKEATIELRSIPFCRFAYFRHAFRGVNSSGMGLFTDTLYVREVPRRAHPNGFSIRVAWV